MARKDIPKAGAYQAEELGNKLYLWHSGTRKQSVVITSHGGYSMSNRPFKVPAHMTIHFYAPHGFILSDPSIKSVTTGTIKPFDSYGPGAWCPNYKLTKYQGSHGGKPGKPAETYGDIAQGMHRDAEIAHTEQFLGRPLNEEELGRIRHVVMDVITIRNRKLMKSPTLEEVIQTMGSKGVRYTHVHCSFCRCRMGMPDELDMSWDARAHAMK